MFDLEFLTTALQQDWINNWIIHAQLLQKYFIF